jgi:hypothetical protein
MGIPADLYVARDDEEALRYDSAPGEFPDKAEYKGFTARPARCRRLVERPEPVPVELRLAPTANKEPPILVGMVRRAARAGLAAHVSDITSSNAHGGAQAEDRDDGRDERGTSG